VSTRTTLHPLEPVTEEEVRAAVAVLRADGRLDPSVRFAHASLFEPPKDVVAAFQPGDPVRRAVEFVCVEGSSGRTFHVVVDVTKGEVVECRHSPGEQAPIIDDEAAVAMGLVKEDPRWQAAMRARGVTDFDLVQLDPWPTGNFGLDFERDRRIIRMLSFVQRDPGDNAYARPADNVVAVIDVVKGEVVDVIDHGVVPLPEESSNFHEAAWEGKTRTDLKPFTVAQPDGPSFTVEGHEIRWQRWRLRVSMHPIEGLVLHTVGYDDPDTGRVRPILHRAALSEMVVPYGDPSPAHSWKNAFDAGEYGLGRAVNSLTLGCDCLGEIHYFDAVGVSSSGEPRVVANAICLHEEDYGILWKHVDYHNGRTDVRRSRRLVISSIHTLANYEYGIFWYLYLDGTIQLELKLTGVVSPGTVERGAQPEHGALVAPQVAAPHHQHLFNFRLDFDVDGPVNSVVELEAEAVPAGDANPLANAWRVRETPLTTERAARRNTDAARDRAWKIVNPNVRNRLGQPVGYKLVPGATPTLLASPDSRVAQRAGFASHNLWVTPFRADERRAAGDLPNQHPGGAGLPAWTEQDRALTDTDVVVWYTFGVNHVARPEDWPVMPVEYTGFTLKPVGFFDRNPALDVPPSTNGHCHQENGSA
jgi:primary-amine oxidase